MSNFHWKFPSLQPRGLLLPSKAAAAAAACLRSGIWRQLRIWLIEFSCLWFLNPCLIQLFLFSGRQQWCPQPAGSSGCLEASLHLLMGNSSIITRISGSCIWLPRPGSRSSKWCVLTSVMLTLQGTVPAWAEFDSWYNAAISPLSTHLSFEYRGAHLRNSGEDSFQRNVEMRDVFQVYQGQSYFI